MDHIYSANLSIADDFQLILLSPCLFLAQDYVLVPRIAQHLAADDLLILPRRTIVILYVLCDILTVLAQLAGTALTITFGDLVSIGVKVISPPEPRDGADRD
jgi:hypothetical protein